MLGEALAIAHSRGGEQIPMIVKAKVILGGFFLEKALDAEAARVRECLSDVPRAVLDRCGNDLVSAERIFWEVTDRQVNLEHVPVERRAHVRAFVDSFPRPPDATPA